jgi:hypothetical protein
MDNNKKKKKLHNSSYVYATSRKVAGSIPNAIDFFFHVFI